MTQELDPAQHRTRHRTVGRTSGVLPSGRPLIRIESEEYQEKVPPAPEEPAQEQPRRLFGRIDLGGILRRGNGQNRVTSTDGIIGEITD